MTTLSIATCAGRGALEEVRKKLDDGVDPDRPDGQWTGLMLAIEKDHHQVVDLLLQRGADANRRSGQQQRTPLTVAAFNGRNECVKLLVQHHANIDDVSGSTKQTALHAAAFISNLPVLKTLLELGADPGIADANQKLPEDLTHNDACRSLLVQYRQSGAISLPPAPTFVAISLPPAPTFVASSPAVTPPSTPAPVYMPTPTNPSSTPTAIPLIPSHPPPASTPSKIPTVKALPATPFSKPPSTATKTPSTPSIPLTATPGSTGKQPVIPTTAPPVALTPPKTPAPVLHAKPAPSITSPPAPSTAGKLKLFASGPAPAASDGDADVVYYAEVKIELKFPHKDDLSLQVGDIVGVLSEFTDDEGEQIVICRKRLNANGDDVPEQGNYPVCMLQQKTVQSVTVQWPYKSIDFDELDLVKGQKAQILMVFDDNWCEGVINKRRGFFPLNHTDWKSKSG
eukprot:TRINITY_DN2011_c1_g1_i3.p1 TRINITY_DN2011_c1_g1~~TRINITY_DN2011_c1_g1_i3.p1  ORF type:complete len:455 (-),score=77.46 TRINITY_DN2011_c1_g1_i3:120-1484(-)